AISLHPTNLGGFTSDSKALGIGGGQQAGWARYQTGFIHAMLWTGTADSAVDLHPTNLLYSGQPMFYSDAFYTDGSHQVGDGAVSRSFNSFSQSYDYTTHALLWSGNAATAIDLHPTALLGFGSS